MDGQVARIEIVVRPLPAAPVEDMPFVGAIVQPKVLPDVLSREVSKR